MAAGAASFPLRGPEIGVPRPEWHPRLFLRAVEESERLRAWVAEHQPRHWKAAKHWRKENGRTCGLYRGILAMIFSQELERDLSGFTQRLRAAGYDQ